MTKSSFNAITKEALAKVEPKKKCCKNIFSASSQVFCKSRNTETSANEVLDSIRCDNCLKEFLRGAFIQTGNITSPDKRYHLDFTFTSQNDANTVKAALESAGFCFGESQRKSLPILYLKESDAISDFLAYIGATKAAFEVMNSKIVKEVRNNANRLVNCDTANIEKAISASQKYIEAIEYIKSHHGLSALPAELREAAELRVQFNQASLNELANKCEPPITKSGMKHRLEKLISLSEELKSRTKE